MKIYKHIMVILSCVVIIACDNKLDLEPQQSLDINTALGNATNIKNLLVGIYDEAAHGSAEGPNSEENIYGGELYVTSELLANDTELEWNGTFTQPREFNFKTITTTNTWVRLIWTNGYEVINQTNIVLENLDKFDDMDERNTIEGEAKFLRALTYFDLVRFFSSPYEAGLVNNQLGVPIIQESILSPSEITKPSRNTVEETYTQVINDLTDSYNLLPSENGEFADNDAARALLARVYFQQGNYVLAAEVSNAVISNTSHQLTTQYSSAFNNDIDSSEDIFAWQITSQDGTNDMNTFWSTRAFGGRSSSSDISINPEYFDIFSSPDDRADFFYEGANNTTVSSKWQSQFANIPFIRLAEMYLIRAESNLREGTSIGATPLSDVNILRERANTTLLTAITLQDILDERKRELAFEGHAIHEAKRLQQNIGTINYNANSLILPIPQREIDVNPNLEQNDGYN